MMVLQKRYLWLLLMACGTVLNARQILLEFKGAYFLPTSSDFKYVYHWGSALYGPELTIQLCNDKPWYVFGSFDYFHQKGHSVGLCDPTEVTLLPLALGVKYVRPINRHFDLYAGLGFEAVNVRTKDYIQDGILKESQWGFGGIAKVGAYCYIPRNFVIDFFIDYSFVRVGSDHCLSQNSSGFQSHKTNISGAIFGVGLGYNFW